MKLFLAVAVLMLAFAAQTEAQDSVETQITNLGTQIGEKVTDIAEKVKAAVNEFQNSEFVTNAKSRAQEYYERMKNMFQEMTSK